MAKIGLLGNLPSGHYYSEAWDCTFEMCKLINLVIEVRINYTVFELSCELFDAK